MAVDKDGESLEEALYNVECGFAYNTGSTQVTYGVIDLYALK